MVAGKVQNILRSPGRLVVNPSTAFDTSSFPYGGLEIGKANAAVLQPLGTSFRPWYESLGEVGDVLEADNRYVFTCFLRGWDDDAVRELLAAGYHLGGLTQHSVFFEPGEATPGASALKRAIRLLFVPDNQIHNPALFIYRGVPDWEEGAEIAYQRAEEHGIPLSVECVRDVNGNILRMGRLQDLPLG